MAEPFESRSRGGVLSRVLSPKRRAIQEIEALLAGADRVRDVSPGSVREIAARHDVDLTRSLRTPRTHLYRRFLEHCLLDHHLTDEEGRDLEHLRELLCLDEASASRVHEEVSQRIYGAAVDEVLEDQRLDPEEQEFLGRLRSELDLPEKLADALVEQGVERARERFFSRAAARSSVFFASPDAPLQLVGVSQSSVEGAVHDALEQACRAVPRLHWIEVTKIRGEVAEGGVKEWRVELKAWLDPEP